MTLIIPVYKQAANLPILFRAIASQSQLPDEIIIANDNDDKATREQVQMLSNRHSQLTVRYVEQADNGFRKAMILNKAVAIAQSRGLAFLDGDCIPHAKMVEEYSKHLGQHKILFSRPVYLADKLVKDLLASSTMTQPSILRLLVSRSRSVECALRLPFAKPTAIAGKSLSGSSWSCLKSDYLSVNGFDEDFCEGGYGHEDTDIAKRLTRAGCIEFSMKHLVVYYHFGLPGLGDAKAAGVEKNARKLAANDAAQLIRCNKGVEQWIR